MDFGDEIRENPNFVEEAHNVSVDETFTPKRRE